MFCEECGNKLNETDIFCGNCGTPNPSYIKHTHPDIDNIAVEDKDKKNNQKYPYRRIKKKGMNRRKWAIIISAIVFCVLLIGCGLWFFLNRQKTFHNVNEVIAEVKHLGKEYGFENATSEMTEKITTKTDGCSFYRLQQNYNGYPVYGRTMVFVTDEKNHQIALTGNLLDVDENYEKNIRLTPEELSGFIREYANEKNGFSMNCSCDFGELTQDQLCLYNMGEDGKSYLAYDLVVNVSDENKVGLFEVLADADTGDIFRMNSLIYQDEFTGSLKGEEKQWKNILYSVQNEQFSLFDPQRNIMSCLPEKEYNWQFLWAKAEEYVDAETYMPHAYINTIRWNETESPPASGVDAYANAQIAYDYFANVLENKAADGNGKGKTVLYTGITSELNLDKEYEKWVNNAYCGSNPRNNKNTLLVFGIGTNGNLAPSAHLDSVAHEYTHSVECFHSGMQYERESGAIMEALSDIFGELVEKWNNPYNTCNWIHSSYRNLQNPNETGNPRVYNGNNWADTSNISAEKDYGGVHQNSTVISHAAYLMWNGIDGTESKKISDEQLAKLWYRSMLMMPSNCSFWECRILVELAADSLHLTNLQKQCIGEAFDNVGIPYTFYVDYAVSKDTLLAVVDSTQELYDDYTIHIEGWENNTSEDLFEFTADFFAGKAISRYHRYSEERVISKAEKTAINLNKGNYKITLIDNKDREKSCSFTVSVNKSAEKKELTIYTDFNDTRQLVSDAYSETRSFSLSSSDPLKEQMVVSYTIPQINLKGDEIKQINDEIYNNLYDDIQYSLKTIDELGVPTGIRDAGYNWYVTDDVLSLIVYHGPIFTSEGGERYWVYNISISEKRLLSDEEVYTEAGFTGKEYYKRAKEALGSCYWEGVDRNDNFIKQHKADFNTFLQKTISDENVEASYPYINGDGQLCLLGIKYSFLYMSDQWVDLNLIEFDLYADYDVLVGQEAGITDTDSSASDTFWKKVKGSNKYPKGKWKTIFFEFVNSGNYLSSGPSYYTDIYGDTSPIEVGLHDIDADGTPELLLSSGGDAFANMNTYLYQLENDSVSYLGTIVLTPYYFDKSGYTGLLQQFMHMGYYSAEYITISSGKKVEEVVWEAEDKADGNGISEAVETTRTKNQDLYNMYMNKSYKPVSMTALRDIL